MSKITTSEHFFAKHVKDYIDLANNGSEIEIIMDDNKTRLKLIKNEGEINNE